MSTTAHDGYQNKTTFASTTKPAAQLPVAKPGDVVNPVTGGVIQPRANAMPTTAQP